MKKKNLITVGIVLILVILIVFTAIFIKPKKEPIKTESIVSSSEDSATIHIDDIEQTENKEKSNKAESFITPDETAADKIIKEHIENKKKKETKTESKTSSKTNKTSSVKTQTREEGEKKLNNTASKYLKEHNIDAATAGETGEVCNNCGKKIWNPDKYGFFIPGMPKDYENSNYCLGTCGVTFE